MSMTEQVIHAARSGYSGPLPGEKCQCGGKIIVTTTQKLGGWVLRRLQCDQCKERKQKWVCEVPEVTSG
jgi:hypothetical protein